MPTVTVSGGHWEGPLGQQGPNQLRQLPRNGGADGRHEGRFLLAVPGGLGQPVVGDEDPLAGEGLVQQAADGVQVAGPICLLPADEFRSQVGDRSGLLPRSGDHREVPAFQGRSLVVTAKPGVATARTRTPPPWTQPWGAVASDCSPWAFPRRHAGNGTPQLPAGRASARTVADEVLPLGLQLLFELGDPATRSTKDPSTRRSPQRGPSHRWQLAREPMGGKLR